MIFKPLLILTLTLGLAQCKSSRVKNSEGLSEPAGREDSSLVTLNPEVKKLLLTGSQADPQTLGISSLKANPFLIDQQTVVVVTAKNSDKADFAHFKICQANDCSYLAEESSFGSVEWVVPAGKKGNFTIFAKACAFPTKADSAANLLSRCGAEASTYINIDQPNNAKHRTYKKLKRRQEVIQKMREKALSMQGPAQKYIAWFESMTEHSAAEEALYVAARNLSTAPVLIADLFGSKFLEEVEETMKQGKQQLNLADSRILVPEIENSLDCRANDYEWDQASRSCYRTKKKDDKEESGSAFNAQTIIGMSLLGVAGVWAYREKNYGDMNPFRSNLDRVRNQYGGLEVSDSFKVEGGKVYRIGTDTELEPKKMFEGSTKKVGLAALVVGGIATLIPGLVQGSKLADGSGGPADDFQVAAAAVQKDLETLRNEFYSLEKEIFGGNFNL